MTTCDYEYEVANKVYVGHDNAVTVIPYSDVAASSEYDLTNTTKVEVSADLTTSTSSGDAIVADSDDAGDLVVFEQVGGSWRIHAKVGLFPGITAGTYVLRHVIYDPTHTNGLVLASDTKVEVIGAP